jgi:predicted anti-sigma-YlaC factor YlaD
MPCSEIHEWMSLQLDNMLDQEQAAQLQAHLVECAACRQEWQAMCAVSQLLEAAPMVVPAPGLGLRVNRRVGQREARRRRTFSILGVLMGSAGLWIAAGLVMAALFVVLWRAPLQVLWTAVGLPLARNTLSIVGVLFNALYAVAEELSRRPTALLLFGDAVLVLGLMLLWTHVVFQRGQQVTN